MSFLPGTFPFMGRGNPTFPSIVNTADSSAPLVFAGNASVTLPASLVSGNLLVVVLSLHETSARNSSTPSGWTELFDIVGPGHLREFSCYAKISNGAEGSSVSIAIDGSVILWAAVAYQINNASGNVEASTTTGTNSAPDPPSLTPTWGLKKTLWLAACSARDNAGATITAAPANYSGLITEPSASNAELTATSNRQLEATSDNPGAFSQTGIFNDWAAATIGIEPAV